MSRIVIVLGGDALGGTAPEQQKKIEFAAPALVGLIKQGHEIIVSHGNGPQVEMIRLAFDSASQKESQVPPMELMECTAMSQGYIGYHLQQGIRKELRKEGLPWHVATIITQVEVDERDPAFHNPEKPIGSFFTKEQADQIMQDNPGIIMEEQADGRYRRMVSCPTPINIVERESILNLLDHEFIVIAGGGGGIPVIKNRDGDYEGVPAIIDKDLASAKLAELVKADYLFFLTAVDEVYAGFEKPSQQGILEMTVPQAEKLCRQGQFNPDSMLPKIQASIQFARTSPSRRAVISSLQNAPLAMAGESGIRIKLKADK